jgi:lipoyl(octanoyl) transferase
MMIIRMLGLQPYLSVWETMKQFTLTRDETTADECWLLEHPAVYTQGQAGNIQHILNPAAIPIIQSDRGGQVTYHGPGQLINYVLLDLNRYKIGVRTLVRRLETMIIALLSTYQITATSRCTAPGVYVADKKVASIGLRVKNGYTYHGIALNICMDLAPFDGINPCGFVDLKMTQLSDYCADITLSQVMDDYHNLFLHYF